MKQPTNVLMTLAPEEVKALCLDEAVEAGANITEAELAKFGITMDSSVVNNAEYASVMHSFDADPNTVTTPSIPTPVQFAQFWLTNIIKVITRARSLDKVVPRSTVGTWETEQIVATQLERVGQPALYGDFTKAPLANWNVVLETFDNVRFEMGINVGKLEEIRASQMRLNTYQLKREAVAEAFEILLNLIGWFGYVDGNGKKIKGLLNTVTVSSGVYSDWSDSAKTFDDITTDIINLHGEAMTKVSGHYDPEVDSTTLALGLKQYNALSKMNSLGTKSVRAWIKETYPKMRIVACAELDKAYGSSGLSETGKGTSDLSLFIVDKIDNDVAIQQMLTSSFRQIGAQPTAKGNYEVYTCSTAGTLVRYPLAVTEFAHNA